VLLRLSSSAGILHGYTMMCRQSCTFWLHISSVRLHKDVFEDAVGRERSPSMHTTTNSRGARAKGGLCSRAVPGLQLPGVLDELFTYSGPLGATMTDSATSVVVWSPTAQHVSV
jgi:hypothetical protein